MGDLTDEGDADTLLPAAIGIAVGGSEAAEELLRIRRAELLGDGDVTRTAAADAVVLRMLYVADELLAELTELAAAVPTVDVEVVVALDEVDLILGKAGTDGDGTCLHVRDPAGETYEARRLEGVGEVLPVQVKKAVDAAAVDVVGNGGDAGT